MHEWNFDNAMNIMYPARIGIANIWIEILWTFQQIGSSSSNKKVNIMSHPL